MTAGAVRRREIEAAAAVRPGPDAIPLANHVDLVRRHPILLLVAVGLGAVLGLVRIELEPNNYTGYVAVLATPMPIRPGISMQADLSADARKPRDATMDTEAQLVRSDYVLSRLAKLPGFHARPSALRSRILITVPPNTQVMTIGVLASDARTAQAGADLVSAAYLELRNQIMGGFQDRTRVALQHRLTLLQKQLNALPGADELSLQRSNPRSRRQAVIKQITDGQQQLGALQNRAGQYGRVVRDAPKQIRPDDPGRDVGLISGAGVGLLCGLLIAFILNRRPHRIRDSADVRRRVRTPVLAEAKIGDPDGVYRQLRHIVIEEGAESVFLVGVPPGAADGPALELAALCASSGSSAGVLRVVADGEGAGDAAVSYTADHLAGPGAESVPVHTARLTDHERDALGELAATRARTDIVLVTGPAAESADAVSVAGECDLTVMLVERGRATDLDVARGVRALTRVVRTRLGIVIIPGTAPATPASLEDSVARRGGYGH